LTFKPQNILNVTIPFGEIARNSRILAPDALKSHVPEQDGNVRRAANSRAIRRM